MVTITEQEYLNYTGVSLAVELSDLDDGPNKIPRILKLWTNRVYSHITKPIPQDDKLSDFQIETIKNAIIEYGEYYLRNGDLYRLSGYDEDKGKTLDASDIEKIKFPKHIIDSLRHAGLIRRNLGVKVKYSQDLDDGWY